MRSIMGKTLLYVTVCYIKNRFRYVAALCDRVSQSVDGGGLPCANCFTAMVVDF